MELRKVKEQNLVVGQPYYDKKNKHKTKLVFVGLLDNNWGGESMFFYPLEDNNYIKEKDGTIGFYTTGGDEYWYEEI